MKKRVPIVPPGFLRIAAQMPKPPPVPEGMVKLMQATAKLADQFSQFRDLFTVEVEIEDERKDAPSPRPKSGPADSSRPAPPKTRSPNKKGRPRGTAKTLNAALTAAAALKLDKPTMSDLETINDYLREHEPGGVKSVSRGTLRTALISLVKKPED